MFRSDLRAAIRGRIRNNKDKNYNIHRFRIFFKYIHKIFPHCLLFFAFGIEKSFQT